MYFPINCLYCGTTLNKNEKYRAGYCKLYCINNPCTYYIEITPKNICESFTIDKIYYIYNWFKDERTKCTISNIIALNESGYSFRIKFKDSISIDYRINPNTTIKQLQRILLLK